MIYSKSLSIFNQKNHREYKDIHFILQNKYLRIYEDSFEAKILNIMIAPIMVGSLKKSIQPDGVHVFLA